MREVRSRLSVKGTKCRQSTRQGSLSFFRLSVKVQECRQRTRQDVFRLNILVSAWIFPERLSVKVRECRQRKGQDVCRLNILVLVWILPGRLSAKRQKCRQNDTPRPLKTEPTVFRARKYSTAVHQGAKFPSTDTSRHPSTM